LPTIFNFRVLFFALRSEKQHTLKIKYHAAAGQSAVSENPNRYNGKYDAATGEKAFVCGTASLVYLIGISLNPTSKLLHSIACT